MCCFVRWQFSFFLVFMQQKFLCHSVVCLSFYNERQRVYSITKGNGIQKKQFVYCTFWLVLFFYKYKNIDNIKVKIT